MEIFCTKKLADQLPVRLEEFGKREEPLENMAAKARTIVFPFTRAGSLSYQGPTAGNTAAASETAFPAGGDGGNHVWTMAQESGSAGLVLCCQGCGR